MYFLPILQYLENCHIHTEIKYASKNLTYYQVLKTSINCLQIFITDCPQASTVLPFLLTFAGYLSYMQYRAQFTEI